LSLLARLAAVVETDIRLVRSPDGHLTLLLKAEICGLAARAVLDASRISLLAILLSKGALAQMQA
jgi:hypothetical protein